MFSNSHVVSNLGFVSGKEIWKAFNKEYSGVSVLLLLLLLLCVVVVVVIIIIIFPLSGVSYYYYYYYIFSTKDRKYSLRALAIFCGLLVNLPTIYKTYISSFI